MHSYLIIFGVISLSAYIYYLMVFHRGLKQPSQEPSYVKRTVSIVVAARNEEHNITGLLTGLINQSYPSELYEIIIVNDRSTDQTGDIVQRYIDKGENVRLINIEETPSSYSPKKYALSKAIESATGEIILLTDADCLVGKNWVETMMINFNSDTDVVAGFSRTRITRWHGANFITRYEFFDFLVIFMAAAGAILSGKAFSCSNQNFAYRRSSFLRVGGFEKIKQITSGDDVNLLQLFRLAKMKITFSLIPQSFVYTKPVSYQKKVSPHTIVRNNLTAFISQRSRWASNSKWQLLLNTEFFLYLSAVFVLNITILITILWFWKLAIILFTVKMLSEYLFISNNFSRFETERKRLSFFLLWSSLQPLYVLTVALLGFFDLFTWKKNTVKS